MSEINTEIHNAFEIIQQGGIILFPSDTEWAIGCDANNTETIKKINTLIKREDTKGMTILINGEKMMYNVFKEIPEVAWQILDFSEKPTTLILDNPRNISPSIIADDNSVGVRIIKEAFCYKLLERMKKPLVSVSANITGAPTANSFKEISPEILKGVDYVVNLDPEKNFGKLSSIIKLTLDSKVTIIRK